MISKKIPFYLLIISLLFVSCEFALEPPENYVLSVSQTGSGELLIQPNQEQYEPGAEVEVSAVPDSGWQFSQWLGDIAADSSTISLTMDSSVALVAQFEEATEFSLTINSDGNGTVQVDPAREVFVEGDSVTLQADAPEGWMFAYWGGDLNREINPVTFAMDSSMVVTAVFIQTGYMLNTSVEGSGTVQVSPEDEIYESGQTVQLDAEPAEGWEFSQWTGDVTADTSAITVTMDSSISVVAHFVEETTEYTLDVTTEGSGTIQIDPQKEFYAEGDSVTLQAEPASGYIFGYWGGDLNREINPVTFAMDSSMTVTAMFIQTGYSITTSINGNGSIQLIPEQDVYDAGELVQVIASPDDGWTFDHWQGAISGTNDTMFVEINEDLNITAVFEEELYFLTQFTEGDGYISRDPLKEGYTYGETVQLTAHPASGWMFENWSGDATGVENPVTITMDSDKEVTAHFVDFTGASGEAWTEVQPDAAWGPRSNMGATVYNGAMWIAGGWNQDGRLGDVWRSTDGNTWEQVTSSADWLPRNDMAMVEFQNQLWIIGGVVESDVFGDNGYSSEVWRSEDGENWELVAGNSDTPWNGLAGHQVVVFGGKMWIIGGFDGYEASRTAEIWSSEDGVNWTLETSEPGWQQRNAHSVVVLDNRMWLFGGTDHPTVFNDVWYSYNGVDWTQATAEADWSGRREQIGLAYDGKLWVINGELDSFSFLNDVWVSEDGVSWNQVLSEGPWEARSSNSGLVFNQDMWLLGGNTGIERYNDVWKSGTE